MELNGQLVSMELDTGATVSLISHSTQQRLFADVPLEKSDVQVATYTAEPIPVLRVMKVCVKYGDYCGTQHLYVVPGNGPTLLGRDWLQSIRQHTLCCAVRVSLSGCQCQWEDGFLRLPPWGCYLATLTHRGSPTSHSCP